jgi:cell division protease FtsH
MATALGAALTVVSGPELKSRWVGESEENLRQIFHQARQSAPAVIVFDELDSFASARGTYTGSGVEHSMVNQLLTELDGFRKGELVFVVGTTNLVEALDPALLRPGRFEFHLFIPYPEADDRREILRIYDAKMRLRMTPDTLEYAVRRTWHTVPGAAAGTRFSGDHLNALCRAVARNRLREDRQDETRQGDVDRALTQWVQSPPQTPAEERVIATHEAGHAVCTLFTPHSQPIERISLLDDAVGASGYVQSQDSPHRYVETRGQLLDRICVLMGGREAELLLLDDLSLGSGHDLWHATQIARELVEAYGMGSDEVGVRHFWTDKGERQAFLSPAQLEAMDRSVREILDQERQRASAILREHRPLVEALRDLLVEKKTLDGKDLGKLTEASGGLRFAGPITVTRGTSCRAGET